MRPRSEPHVRRGYGRAVLVTVMAAGAVEATARVFGVPAFLPFILAIAISDAIGGPGPSVVSATLAAVASVYVFLPPPWTWSTEESPWALVLVYAAAVVAVRLWARLEPA